ncbi:MAG: hypothetical protein ACRBM6_08770 [Geminicoccales bacterium]
MPRVLSDADQAWLIRCGGHCAPYRERLLEAFDVWGSIPLEIRIASLLELASHRLPASDVDQRRHLAENLYTLADKLAGTVPTDGR